MIEREDRDFILSAMHVSANKKPTFNLAMPRSLCLSCYQPILWYHNIPAISWLWLGGKCASCSQPISVQYPIVELSTGILFLLVFSSYGFSVEAGLKLIFFMLMVCVVYIDWQHRLVPDSLSMPLIGLGLLASTFYDSASFGVASTDAILGMIIGYSLFALLNLCYRLLTQKTGIGGGDFRLAAAIGAWFGWVLLPWVLLISAFTALCYGLWLLLRSEYDSSEGIQFGSFLGLASILLLLLRDTALLPSFILI